MQRRPWWRLRYERWLDRRIPAARSITLDQTRVFVFPSRAGLLFMVALAVMLLAAINYQNNMAFALVFFLFSLFVVAILHTFSNLSGLSIEALRGHNTFAGATAEFDIQLRCPERRTYHSIQLQWPDQPLAVASLLDEKAVTVKLFHAAPRRGWLRPRRLRIQTEYPLGLVRAWTWIDLDIAAVVYPNPLTGPRPAGGGDGDPRGEQRWRSGSDDFYGFREYRSGDNLRHVMWRAYAKGLPLQSKQFAEVQMQSQWLRWEDMQGEREYRLSILCHWVLELHRRNEPFGLLLPGEKLPAGIGEEHRDRALRMLALFGQARAQERGEVGSG